MMIVALPFAHFQRAPGGVGFRIFAGTMLGLAFFLIGRLFSSLGVLNDWPPLFSAVLPLASSPASRRHAVVDRAALARRPTRCAPKKKPRRGGALCGCGKRLRASV